MKKLEKKLRKESGKKVKGSEKRKWEAKRRGKVRKDSESKKGRENKQEIKEGWKTCEYKKKRKKKATNLSEKTKWEKKARCCCVKREIFITSEKTISKHSNTHRNRSSLCTKPGKSANNIILS